MLLCSAKPDTICSSGGKDTCFPPLLLFFWFLLGFSAPSSLCSSFSLSLQRVIPQCRSPPWSCQLKFESKGSVHFQHETQHVNNLHSLSCPWSHGNSYGSNANLKREKSVQQLMYKQLLGWLYWMPFFPLCGPWKDKTLKKQYLIHELCTGLRMKPNMFVSNDTFKIGKALHIYIHSTVGVPQDQHVLYQSISLTRVFPGLK